MVKPRGKSTSAPGPAKRSPANVSSDSGERFAGEAAQPAWRQPPPKPRRKMRRNQARLSPAAAPRATAPPDPASAARRAPSRRLRLGAYAWLGLRLLFGLAVVVGCVVGLAQLLRLPELTVTASSTQIGGSQRISTQEIYAASQLEGRSILLVRPEDVGARVAGIQGIAGVDVHVRLPNQVLIDVLEYQPLVAWQGITSTLWLSADGTVVPQVGSAPALTLIDRTAAPLGDSARMRRDLLPSLAEIHNARPDLSVLSYGQLEGLYFLAPEGWTVWLGDSGSMTNKLALLAASAGEIAAQATPPKIIDMRFSETQALLRQ